MPPVEHRSTLATVELREQGEGLPLITGTAAVFHDAGNRGTEYEIFPDLIEYIRPGAFAESIQRAARGELVVEALFNHDPSALLGSSRSKTLQLVDSAAGLGYRIDPPDTQVGRDTVTSLRRGDVGGSSFGFRKVADQWRTELRDGREVTIRELIDLELVDVGPVTRPAYMATSAEAARSRSEFAAVVDEYANFLELHNRRDEARRLDEYRRADIAAALARSVS